PNRPIPALQLTSRESSGFRLAGKEIYDEDTDEPPEGTHPHSAPSGPDDILDSQALTEYRARYDELQEEIEEARRHKNTTRLEKALTELQELAEHLRRVTYQQSPRSFPTEADRARVSVRQALTRTFN